MPKQFSLGRDADDLWLRAAALRPGCPLIAITSADGGVGRSTLTAALGGLLALACPRPVVALDMSLRPWAGLADRVGQRNDATVWDAVAELQQEEHRSLSGLVQHGPTGLHALVAESRATPQRHPPGWHPTVQVLHHLRTEYPLALLDLPVAEVRPIWLLLIESAVPVLVARASTDSLRHVMQMLHQIRGVGHPEVSQRTTLVVVETAPNPMREVKAAERTASGLVRAVHRMPYDPALARPSPIDVRQLRRPTRSALLTLAADLLRGCPADPQLAARLIQRSTKQ